MLRAGRRLRGLAPAHRQRPHPLITSNSGVQERKNADRSPSARPPASRGCAAVSKLFLPLLAAIPLAPPSILHAQETARAVRTQTPPRIDGDLSDPAWKEALPFGSFHQIDPVLGPPTERTEVRILFDERNLYIGIRLFDSHPELILSTSKERDARLEADDRVEFILDTFHDRRNAFFFQMNAAGSKGDALITDNGADFNKPWDGIWEGKSRIDELGWTIEIAIPFKTLNFREGLETWGLNFERTIGRRNETDRWNGDNRNVHLFTIAAAGELTGLTGLRQGIGLDVVPFFVANSERTRIDGEETHIFGSAGVDAFQKLTPNLTLSLTLNTDFAETEVDGRQINLTRFPLFFPERRDFFLQDAGNFAFGDQGRGDRFRPFFSRRIGLVDGEEVGILAGAKLTGRVGDYNVGVLDVQTDSADTDASGPIDAKNLLVARVSKNVGDQSRIGGIVTHGDPTDPDGNTVLGVDARYSTTSFRGDKTLSASAWALRSDSGALDASDTAVGGSLQYPNDVVNWRINVREVGENFDPALGFVSRTGVRQYWGDIGYRPRVNESIRSLLFGIDAQLVTDTNDVLETWQVGVDPFGIRWNSGDEFGFSYDHVHDELREDFEISDGVVIPTGSYDYDRVRFDAETAELRPVSADFSLSGGEFFDGHRTALSTALRFRTGPFFKAHLEYERNRITLPGGDFTTQIVGLRTKFSFTPDLSWNTFLQWDNESDTVGINSRLRYIPKPGREVFFVVNQTFDKSASGFEPVQQGIAFKVSTTLRF
ncbi:MAG TPA: hypothetical protein ENJ09_03705 [Planctomycetes bacterium]|nr:hypothetical protein [Planctomycetota bacterium]